MADIKDALIYSSIGNNLNSSTLPEWNTFKLTADDVQNASAEFANIVSNTTLKRACCLANKNSAGKYMVSVRIPAPSGYTYTDDASSSSKKFGYIDKTITIDPSMCNSISDHVRGSPTCNKFYKVYCANMRAMFREENGNKMSYDDFYDYKPECACFGEIPDELKQYSMEPACMFGNCDLNSQKIYTVGSACNANICTQLVNMGGMSVGGDASIKTTLTNKCGASSVTTPTQPTQPSTSGQQNIASPSSSLNQTNQTSTPSNSSSQSAPATNPSSSTTNPTNVTKSQNQSAPITTSSINIRKYFTSDGNYLGIIIVVVLLILFCSSSLLLIRRRK